MTNHILKNDGKLLHNLFQKLERLREFSELFALYVEPNIVAHCKLANFQNNCLIVIVDSGNWATQLRFHIPDLIIKLRQHPPLKNIQAICCKTRPDSDALNNRKRNRSRPMKQLSAKAAALMLQSIETIQDENIRKVMEKIAKR